MTDQEEPLLEPIEEIEEIEDEESIVDDLDLDLEMPDDDDDEEYMMDMGGTCHSLR